MQKNKGNEKKNKSQMYRLEEGALSFGGDNNGYMATISWRRQAMVPKEFQRIGAKSATASRFLLSVLLLVLISLKPKAV